MSLPDSYHSTGHTCGVEVEEERVMVLSHDAGRERERKMSEIKRKRKLVKREARNRGK